MTQFLLGMSHEWARRAFSKAGSPITGGGGDGADAVVGVIEGLTSAGGEDVGGGGVGDTGGSVSVERRWDIDARECRKPLVRCHF